jgi:hypothetical protein
MCIMEIHPKAHRSTMVQAIAHNLSTIDRDLDMLYHVAVSRNDHNLTDFAVSVQAKVNRAYAEALDEFGIEAASLASDEEGHIHREPGNERTIEQTVNSATKAAKKDETR